MEIGPDKFPKSSYQELIYYEKINWETLDIVNNKNLTYIATNGYTFPIKDEQFDIVLSGQVIEHVPEIWRWIKEVTRICRKGGWVITIAPVSWTFHEAPVDCWRIYPSGMKALYKFGGLEMKFCQMECLENSHNRQIIPGISNNYVDTDSKFKSKVKDFIHWPTTFAYDTIAIGRKESFF
ncbi:MAG: class I SAM-dependent methyltransferase [Bacteroidales bacterium]|nr:class I SAM-dependent methyltransferase [Bacteroidales bacterium]